MIPPLCIAGGSVPRVHLAQRAPLSDRGFAVVYSHQGGHALHLHGYRGRWRCGSHEEALHSGVITMSPQAVGTAYDLAEAGWHWVVHFAAEPGRLAVPSWCDLGSDAAYARGRLARITALHALIFLISAASTLIAVSGATTSSMISILSRSALS
ncbi:MAG: hypothetical protein J0M02_18435 [Planctomycetes bacterium]|nr:hypothetical protein [Planctomycetota bacterium]